ncbi:hypothetical protein, partial [uncultured Nostoc sp.]|uniref:hypothetical protein n=1 Tax=uncultured Nostoc sp. TaxID=340711 RepID=UPI0035CC3831
MREIVLSVDAMPLLAQYAWLCEKLLCWVKQSATQQSPGNVGFCSSTQPTHFKAFGANPSVLIVSRCNAIVSQCNAIVSRCNAIVSRCNAI